MNRQCIGALTVSSVDALNKFWHRHAMIAEVAEIQARAESAGQAMLPVIERAGVAYTTWTRWKNGASPNISNLNRVRRALDEILQARAA